MPLPRRRRGRGPGLWHDEEDLCPPPWPSLGAYPCPGDIGPFGGVVREDKQWFHTSTRTLLISQQCHRPVRVRSEFRSHLQQRLQLRISEGILQKFAVDEDGRRPCHSPSEGRLRRRSDEGDEATFLDARQGLIA